MSEKTYEGTKQTFQSEKTAAEALHNNEGKCFDCNCDVTTTEDDIENGSLLAYEEEGEEFFVFKCNDCFAKNEGLDEYKKCEVYSRIVGYLRPVNQWNDGKKQEYTERKEYNIKEE